ncbi:uncharacterized protein [Mytilus edulis]|uniref:uncharacterized protein isoform X2 n=1 Tax=Mytilus edulis TaxID=6550 RepID=UPI0039EEE9AF
MDRTKNHHFKNEKGQAPTHKFASHIINDLVQRGFLEENYASGMPTKKKSKTNAKFIDEQFRKPNAKFIDEQIRKPNTKFIDEQFRKPNAKFIDEQFRKPNAKFIDEQFRKTNAKFIDGQFRQSNAKFIDEQIRKPNAKFIDEQFRKTNAKFIDEQFSKPKTKFKDEQIRKPNAEFIDEQFSKPNNKHSIKILPASQTPERDYFRISPRVIDSDYSEMIHSTVEPVPSQKPSVMSELMKIGFVDKFTLPIIDRKKSNNINQETMSRSKLDSSQYTVLETKDKANNFNEQTVNGNIISKNIAGQTGKNKPNEKNTNAQNPNSQTILSKDLKILELMKLGFIDKDTKDLTKSDVTRVMQDIEGTKALQEHLQSSVKLSINSKAIAQNYRSTSSNIDSPKENERQEDMTNNKQIVPSDYKVSNMLIGEAKTITDNQKHGENNEKTISKDNKILELMKMGFIDEPTLPIIDLTKTDVIKTTSKTGDSEVKNTNENKQIDRLNSERVNVINRDVTIVNRDGQLKSELINLVLKDGTEKLNDIEVGVYNKQTQDNIEGKAPLKTTKLPKRKTKLKFNETTNSTQNAQLQLNRSKAERQINQSRKYLNQKKIDQQQFIASIIRKQKEKWKKKSKKSKKLPKSKTQNAQLQFNKSVDVNDKEKRKIQDTIINKENIIKSDNTNTHLQLNMLLSERKINQSGKSLNIKSQAESKINQSGKSLIKKSQAESQINQSGKSLNIKKLDPKEFIASIIRKQKEKWKKKSRSRMKNKTKSRIHAKPQAVIGAQTNESVLEFVENPSRMNVIAKSEIGTLDNEDITDQLKFNHSITGSPMNLKDSLQNAPKKAKKSRRRKQKKTPNEDKTDNKEMLKLLEKDLTSPVSHSVDDKNIKIKEIKLLKKELTTPVSQSVDDKNIKIKEILTSKSPSKEDDPTTHELYPHTVRGIPKSLLKHDVDMIIQKTVLSGRKAKKQRTKSKKAKKVELAKHKYKEDRKLLPVNPKNEKSLKLLNQNKESTNDDAKMTPQKRKETSKTGDDDSTIESMKTISKEISPTHESSLSSMDSILHATNIPSKKHSKETLKTGDDDSTIKSMKTISKEISPTHESSVSSMDSILHATNIPSKNQTDDISEPIMPNQMPVKSSDELPPIKALQHVYTNKTTKTIDSEKTTNETLLNENEIKSIKIQNLTNPTLDGIETKQVSSSEILDTAVIDKSPLENTFDEPGNEGSADSNFTMKQTDTKDINKHVVDHDDTNTAEVVQDKLLTAGNIINTNEDLKGRVTPRDKNVSIISTDKQSRQSLRDRNDPKTTKGVKGIVIMGETVPSKERSDRVQLGDRNIKKSNKDEDSIKRKDENDFIKQLRDLKEKLMSDAANEKSTSGNDEDGVSSVDTIVKERKKKKPLVSKKDLKDMYKEMNYSDPKINIPDVSSNTNRRNRKFPQIHSVPSGRGGVNSVSYSAILRSLRKEGGDQPRTNKPNIVGEQFLGASSNFDYPTTTSKQDLVRADKQKPTPTVPTSVNSIGLVSAPRVDRTENTKWASLASGIMQRDKKAPGVVIDNKKTSIVGGKKWPAMVAQHLQWTDTAPNSMSLSVGHNTDGRYISDPSTGRDRYRGTIDKVNSGMHLNGQGVLNVRPTQSKTADNDHLFENILNSLVDVAMDSPYLEQQKRGSIVDQPRGVVVEKSIKAHPSNGNPTKPMYNQRDRHINMNNNREMMDNYRISSVPVPQHTDRNSNTQVNRIKDQNSVDLSLGYQQTTSTQPPNLFTYGKSSQNYWWHDRQVKGRKSDVLTFSGANVPSNGMQRRLGNNPGNSAKSNLQNSRVSNSDINRSRPRNRHDRISMVGAPDMGFHSRDQGIEAHSREPDMGFHSRDQGIELHSREPDMGLHYRDSVIGLHSREPDIGLHSRDPRIGLHSREPDTGLHSRDQGIGLHSREPDMGLNSRDPGIGLHSREPDIGLHSRDPRIELHSRDPRIELHSREPDMGLHYQDSGIGLHSREPDIGLHSRDPRIGLHSREPDTGLHSRDPGIGLRNREPDIGLHSRDPRIGLQSSDPRIELHSGRAYDLHNNGEIQATDVNLNNKPSQMYSNIELPGLKAPGLQIRPMDTPKKTNIQFGGLSRASNGANDHQGQIQIQGEPNMSIQPDQRLTNKKTIHLMPGIRGAHDILSLQNQQHSEPALTDTQTPTVPYSRLLPPEDAQYNTIPGSPNYGFPFEMSLHQFQHSNNQGTRRKRVISPQEMAGNNIHYDVGPANEVSSNNLNPNDYAYENSGQPHEVVVNINLMKNLSKVCAPHERFTCNPVENNVAVSDLRSMCMSSCSNGVCPVDKCSCFCVSLTTLDVKNIIVASNKKVPSRQTNSLGHILENSGTGTRTLPKTVNIIGINAGRQGTGSPNLPKSVNIIGLNSGISGSNLPMNSNTVNNIAMEAGSVGTGSHNPSKTVIINGMNAENSLIDFPQPYETVNNIGLNAGNLGTSSHTPSKTVNILGMNAENSLNGFPPQPFETVNNIGLPAPPTTLNTANMIGSAGNYFLPHDFKPMVTCTPTSLFLSIKGMVDWCNTECGISLDNCPWHICECQFIL